MKFKWKTKKRLFILSLDGVPYSFLQEGISAGRFSNIDRLGEMVEIKSVFPPVSSVAWATFATGVNPANHGIFGFIDRDPATMTQRIPTSRDLVSPTIWQMLNDAGRRTIAMNVPLTYPPREVNGVMISGFLCTKLEQGVQPPSLLPRLRQLDYRIDPDPAMAAEDSAGYLDEILTTLRARRRALFALLKEPWDLFMCHVMMTDRINHFFWADGQQEDSAFYERFWQFYDEIDALVGEVNAALASNTEFLVLSDHGFCRLCQEVDLNAYLAEGGFLRLTGNGGEGRSGVDPSSRAYSLLPGRIY
ncbi:MAG TPA: alkaline phosphatase family protein, partial [Candidatus Heimdallarchaeota archaeon]|nr:alkaline phosphatase family protein [Candidatus Heimdallarchaeota archaeon]